MEFVEYGTYAKNVQKDASEIVEGLQVYADKDMLMDCPGCGDEIQGLMVGNSQTCPNSSCRLTMERRGEDTLAIHGYQQ